MNFFNTIGKKLIIPLMLILFLLLAVNYYMNKNILGHKIIEHRNAYFQKQTELFSYKLDQSVLLIQSVGSSLSSGAASLAQSPISDNPAAMEAAVEPLLQRLVESTPRVYGYGLWFEAGVVDGREYFGPYAYREDGEVKITWSYSNAEYAYREQQWYQQIGPDRNPEKHFRSTSPYYDSQSGETFITIGYPIYSSDGSFLGAVSIDWTLGFLPKLLSNSKLTKSSFPFLIDRETSTILYHPDSTMLNRNFEGYETLSDSSLGTMDYYTQTLENIDYEFGIAVPVSEAFGDIQRTLFIISLSLLIATLLVALVVYLISYTLVVRPINTVASRLSDIAGSEADLTARLEARSNDEVGALSKAFNLFTSKLQEIINGIRSALNSADKDMEQTLSNSNETSAAITEIQSNIQAVESSIVHLHENIQSSVQALQAVQTASGELNNQVNSQVAAIEETSSAAEEINAQAYSIKDTVDKRIQRIENLNSLVGESKKDFNQIDDHIKELIRRTEDMISATAIINNIAAQTNLLSMNAAIEAAHAGDAGKGFAVVAEEIRKLAETASENSKTISSSLSESVSSVKTLSDVFSHSQSVFDEVHAATDEVSDAFSEIVNTVQELSGGISEITSSVLSIRDAIETINEESSKIKSETSEVSKIDQKNEQIGESVKGAIEEIHIGAEEINKSMIDLNESIRDISEQLSSVRSETDRFHS